MHLYERKRLVGFRGVIVTVAVLVLAAFGFIRLVSDAGARSEAEQEAQLQEAVRRATVTCYAAEGQYPPSLDYLEEHYALRFDDERFIVSYDAFASNIMPSVSILRRDDDA